MPGEFYIQGKKEKIDISGLVAAALELEDKLDSIVVYRGRTTTDGAVDGSTLICADFTMKPDYDGNLVVIKSGAYAGQSSQINGDTTGGIVVPCTSFGGQIVSGVSFAVLGIRADTAAIAAIEGELDDASHGLAALKSLIDAINANQGDPSADTLKSTVAKIGDSAITLVSYLSTLTTNLGDFTGYTLTSIAAAIGNSATTLVSYLSSIKAETDRLKNTVAAAVYAHPNSIAEQDACVFAAAIQKVSIRFDMSGLAQKTTVREKEQVDGANYREISAKVFPDDFDPGCQEVVIDYVQANALYKITFQSAVQEGGVVNIPYRTISQDLS